MGYYEAIEDGVRYYKSETSLMANYFPLCNSCGAEVKSFNYIRGYIYTCQKCKLENRTADKEFSVLMNAASKEKKLEKAIKRISNVSNIKKYEETIRKIRSKLHTPGWFDSTEEIMVAIELVKNNVKARHQVKLGTRYRADFILPEEKIVLEVDGKIFHSGERKEKDKLRDELIELALGPEWEIVRISDELINQNIKKLVPAIRKVRDKRKQLKSENNGNLPDWYKLYQ